MFVKEGDTVEVMAGKDRGVRGKVLDTLPKKKRLIVEGVNQVKKHTRVTQTTRGAKAGGIVTTEASINASNVMVVCPQCDRPTRIGHRQNDEGHNVRVCKKCGADVA